MMQLASSSRRLAVAPVCSAVPKQRVAQCSSAQAAAPRLQQVLGAAALGLTLALAPMQPAHAAQARSLADVVRQDYSFVDVDSDGFITKTELAGMNKKISQEEGVPMIGEDQLNFSLRLWDLNQDGKVEAEEMLRAIALDGAVDEETIDADVFKVFDANKNSTVEEEEFSRALGDLGTDGEAMKSWVFRRTDYLTQTGGHLDANAFGNALIVARTAILGY